MNINPEIERLYEIALSHSDDVQATIERLRSSGPVGMGVPGSMAAKFTGKMQLKKEFADLDSAYEMITKARQLVQTEQEREYVNLGLGSIHYQRAVLLVLGLHDFEGAIKEYETAIGHYDTVACRYELGNVYLEQGFRDRAIAQFQAATQLTPLTDEEKAAQVEAHKELNRLQKSGGGCLGVIMVLFGVASCALLVFLSGVF